ncbi:sugar phosphate nucleotidyltransferase [bacterium]|nr:sugar phosphate nucleotidyltransferase [bacterium]
MKAVILAGGQGTRLAPYTTIFPKPLVPIGNMPILEIVIRQLIANGFEHISLTVGYLSELIKAFFLTHRKLSSMIDIQFIEEEKPTGTAGSLCNVPDLDQTFLVMNGDILTTLNYKELVNFHKRSGALLTIDVHQKQVKIDLGVLEIDQKSNQVSNYIEKPEYLFSVSMGIYVYDSEVIQYIPKNTYFDFPSLVIKLIKLGKKVKCYQSDCIWLDIGNAEDYANAQNIFQQHRAEFNMVDT